MLLYETPEYTTCYDLLLSVSQYEQQNHKSLMLHEILQSVGNLQNSLSLTLLKLNLGFNFFCKFT